MATGNDTVPLYQLAVEALVNYERAVDTHSEDLDDDDDDMDDLSDEGCEEGEEEALCDDDDDDADSIENDLTLNIRDVQGVDFVSSSGESDEEEEEVGGRSGDDDDADAEGHSATRISPVLTNDIALGVQTYSDLKSQSRHSHSHSHSRASGHPHDHHRATAIARVRPRSFSHTTSRPRSGTASSDDDAQWDTLAMSRATVSSRQVLRHCGVGDDGATAHATTRRRSSLSVDVEGSTWEHVPLWLRPAIAALIVVAEENSTKPHTAAYFTPAGDDGGDLRNLQWAFECVDIPAVPVEQYAGIVCSMFPSMAVWVRALALLDEFCVNSGVQVNKGTIHRLLVTAVFATARAGDGSDSGSEQCDSLLLGIEPTDLDEMVQDFCTGLQGSNVRMTDEDCLAMLFPFSDTPRGPVMAAYLMMSGTRRLPWRERVAGWVSTLPREVADDMPSAHPPAGRPARDSAVKRTASKLKDTVAKLKLTSRSLKKMFTRKDRHDTAAAARMQPRSLNATARSMRLPILSV